MPSPSFNTPSNPRLMILGAGDLGIRLANRPELAGWCLYGMRRQPNSFPDHLQRVVGDLGQVRRPASWPQEALDFALFCPAPDHSDETHYRQVYDRGLRHALTWLQDQARPLQRLFVVSSTSVYGQSQGEWVDEDTALQPLDGLPGILQSCEALAAASGLPVTRVRLAGLYGPGRTHLLEQIRRGADSPAQPVHYSNRIHIDDAAALLAHLLQNAAAGLEVADCYLGVDDYPAPLHEVADWLRQRLGVSATAGLTLSRRGGSKRCCNARARSSGWSPQYPDYRAGFSALLPNPRPTA